MICSQSHKRLMLEFRFKVDLSDSRVLTEHCTVGVSV